MFQKITVANKIISMITFFKAQFCENRTKLMFFFEDITIGRGNWAKEYTYLQHTSQKKDQSKKDRKNFI